MFFDSSSVKKMSNEQLERDLSLVEGHLLSVVEEIKTVLDYDVSDLSYAEINHRLLSYVMPYDKGLVGLHLRFSLVLQRYRLLHDEFTLKKRH